MNETLTVEIQKKDDCLDGVYHIELLVSRDLDEGGMRALAAGARLAFYPQFPRPYFRIEMPEGGVLQGILKTRQLRLTVVAEKEVQVVDLVVQRLKGGM